MIISNTVLWLRAGRMVSSDPSTILNTNNRKEDLRCNNALCMSG